MKSTWLALALLLWGAGISWAQSVWVEPATPGGSTTGTSQVKIYFDKAGSSFWDQGPNGVFLHAAAVTSGPSGSEWVYGNGDWTDLSANKQMTQEGAYWVKTITPSTYFNVPSGQTVYRIQMVFRNEYDPGQPNNVANNGGNNFFVELQVGGGGSSVYTFDPATPLDTEPVTITFDASLGASQSLVGASKVYLHSAAITSSPTATNWEYGKGNWGQDDGVGEMTSLGNDQWSITIDPRTYYNVTDPNQDIFRITFVFRNADGSAEEKNGTADFLHDINPGFYLVLAQPTGSNSVVQAGGSVPVQASTPSNATYTVKVNGATVNTQSGVSSINYTASSFPTPGTYTVEVTATNGSETKTKSTEVQAYSAVVTQALPAGMRYGINYHSGDATKATLVLHLPTQTKNVVHVIGSFNNWEVQEAYKMKRTPAGDVWWLELTGLTPGQEYLFQYFIDGSVRVADPYTHKVADPWHDGFISSTVYPGLLPYPYSDTDQIVGYLQTNQPEYAWEVPNFTVPVTHNKLNIYELHIRDFSEEGTYNAVTERLDYLLNMGINCIHLMPVSEFEGNDSWGYNPNFYFAADKAYGTPNDLKRLIDEAHKRGIAVINDIVLNHAFNTNVLARMYWDEANNRPAANNPWFNAQHNFVDNTTAWWGSDFNHHSTHTQAFMDSVLKFWMTEFKFDGFRFDFTKGFSNTLWYGENNWASDYDAPRVALLKRMVDEMRAHHPSSIVVFEHLADQPENKELADYGILHWGGAGVTRQYEEVVLGWEAVDLTNSYSKAPANDFAYDNLISYMESHDEQRIAYHLGQYGRTFIKNDSAEFFNRLKLAATVNMLIPGPRMVWQFGELGYDVDINFNGKTGRKPVLFDEHYVNPYRRDLYNHYLKLLGLRKKYSAFHNMTSYALDGFNWVKQMSFASGDTVVRVWANMEAFDASDPNNAGHYEYFDIAHNLPAGSYYEAVSGEWHNISGSTYRIYAGDMRIYSNYELTVPLAVDTTYTPPTGPDPAPTNYCASSGTLVGEDWIKRVQVLQGPNPLMDNFSGRDAGYGDFTDSVAAPALTAGAAYKVAIFPGRKDTGLNRLEGYKVWIDWNRDGDFRDDGELVYSRNLTDLPSVRGDFTVPAGASIGLTRMRVQMKYGQIPFGSCETFSRGEVEDYLLNIVPSSARQTASALRSKAGQAALAEALTVFPNPADEVLHLQAPAQGPVSVTLYNMVGVAVYQADAVAEGQLRHSIPVHALESGLYVVTVQTADGQRSTAKVSIR